MIDSINLCYRWVAFLKRELILRATGWQRHDLPKKAARWLTGGVIIKLIYVYLSSVTLPCLVMALPVMSDVALTSYTYTPMGCGSPL